MRSRIVRNLRGLDEVAVSSYPGETAPCSDFDLNDRPSDRVDNRLEDASRLRPAAVLVPIVDRPGGYTVLLTQRTDHLHDHAGQVSFPGGRLEAADRGPVAAALRETFEEVGLQSQFIEVVGALDDYETVTGYRVTPVVSFVTDGFELVLDEFEVADVFEVPLGYLLDPANHEVHSLVLHGQRRHYYAVEYEGRYIWGATAGMLMNLYRRVSEENPLPSADSPVNRPLDRNRERGIKKRR